MKSKDRIKTISYLALYVALYIVLKYVGNMIPVLQMPNGGSIELELIAVFIASYHLGWKLGLCTAVLSWTLTVVLGFPMYFVHPIQIVLDYVGPLAVCGLASLLWPFHSFNALGRAITAILLGVVSCLGIYMSWSQTMAALIAGVVVAIGVFAFTYWYLKEKKRFGIVIAMCLKYFLQVLSGVYYWMPEGAAAGSGEAWVFSLGYNLWYNVVTMVVCIFAVPLLIDSLQKANIKFAVK